MLTIKHMKAMAAACREGREVEPWVKFILAPQPMQPAQEPQRRAKETLKLPLAALRGPAAKEEPERHGERGPAPEADAPAEAAPAETPRAVRDTLRMAPAIDTKHELVWKLRNAPDGRGKAAAANSLVALSNDIDDRLILRDIAVHCDHKYLSHSAVEALGYDAESLAYVVENATFEDASKHALERLCTMVNSVTDEGVLTLIGERAESARTKRDAAARLAAGMDALGVDALKVVATSAPDELERQKAADRLGTMASSLTDVKALKIIAAYAADGAARSAALAKLAPYTEALKTVAVCSSYKETRMEAVGMVWSLQDMREIALNALDDDVALAAIGAFAGSEKELMGVHRDAPRQAAREAAAAMLCEMAGELEGVDALKVVVLSGDGAAKRKALATLGGIVEDLNDRHALIYVAIWGPEWRQRRAALNALSGDREALSLVSETTEHDDSKTTAGRFLREMTAD